ncbi:MAG: putative membrane protein [Flavobacteriales bacterium]|jgi:putative membrane protein
MTKHLSTAFKGMAMGMAEVIPGVSGGTIAFITGIYEKLLNSIKAFGPEAIRAYKEGGVSAVWIAINGTFLVTLVGGMVLGIVVGVFGITYLLDNYPPAVWAFFFGLIIASAIYIGRQISKWSAAEIGFLVIGAIIAYGITIISPAEGSHSLLFVFLCGVLAISALILPGISGSFILLLLGMYTYVINDTLKPALSTFAFDKLLVMFVFAMGCLTGLMTVSRLLSWTFKHYRSVTLATLTGFMLGSLNKIWPWRNPIEWLRDDAMNIILNEEGLPKKILMEENVLPGNYDGGDPMVLMVVVMIVLGLVTVFGLEKLGGEKSS